MTELKEAVKILRKEVRMTQKEFAEALGFSCSTIKRWEGGTTIPDTTAMRSLLGLAERREVSAQCKKHLEEALSDSRRHIINLPDSALYAVERESICQLVDDSHNAVYVCDLETDEMLYVNHRATQYIGKPFLPEKKKNAISTYTIEVSRVCNALKSKCLLQTSPMFTWYRSLADATIMFGDGSSTGTEDPLMRNIFSMKPTRWKNRMVSKTL